MPDVICLGELLIDFVPTQSGVSLIDAPAFIKAPGGAPANVAVGLARLGAASGFMGQVGDDPFGHFLAHTLRQNQVDVSALCFSPEANTMLAFVSLQAGGERDFIFYRNPSADMLYRPGDVEKQAAYLRSAKIFHFGSISLIGDPSRSATLRALAIAREAGAMISYDPNLRLNLWPDQAQARQGLRLGWPHAHVIKVSEAELRFLSGEDELTRGAYQLWHDELRLLVVTQGERGCTYFTADFQNTVPGFDLPPIDTTGAGDGFVAGLLKGLLEQPQADRDQAQLDAICRYANAVGALTTTRRGAIPALPTSSEVDAFLKSAAI
jgi:fructokinase